MRAIAIIRGLCECFGAIDWVARRSLDRIDSTLSDMPEVEEFEERLGPGAVCAGRKLGLRYDRSYEMVAHELRNMVALDMPVAKEFMDRASGNDRARLSPELQRELMRRIDIDNAPSDFAPFL